jgi:hypothetical protein
MAGDADTALEAAMDAAAAHFTDALSRFPTLSDHERRGVERIAARLAGEVSDAIRHWMKDAMHEAGVL